MVSAQGAACFGIEAAAADKRIEEIRTGAKLRAAGRQIPAPLGHQGLIAHLLFWRQIHKDAALVIGRNMLLGSEFFSAALIDKRTDESREFLMSSVGALKGCAQSQPPGSSRLLKDGAITVRGEMMDLVEDEEAVAIEAAAFHCR